MREEIVWRKPTEASPHLDDVVLVCYQEGRRRAVFIGYMDEEDTWRDVGGSEFGEVLAWAPIPRGVPA